MESVAEKETPSESEKALSAVSEMCNDLARGYGILKQIYTRYDLFDFAKLCSETEHEMKKTAETLGDMADVERLTKDFFAKKRIAK